MIVDHLHRHEDPEYFKCNICDQVLAERRCLQLHMKLHEDKYKGRIYKCAECSKSYYNRTIFLRHQLTHTPEEKCTISCKQCNKFFPTNYTMENHYKRVHLNKYAKICEICGKSIYGKFALDSHIKEHAGVTLLVQCDICGISLTTKYGLARHKKMMHISKNRQPIQCKSCPKISASLQSHQKHMQYKHQTQYKYQCPLCENAFRRNHELKEHLTIDTGDVLYTCPHCTKTFISNANIYSHRKKYHPKEWENSRLLKIQQKGRNKSNGVTSILAISIQKTIQKKDLEDADVD